jgi:cysteine desulfurase
LNGHPAERLPNNLNVSFDFVEGESLLSNLAREIAVSSSSACTSARAAGASHVLKALGLKQQLLHNSIRFGLGRFTTEEEIDFAANRVAEAVIRLRELSPFSPKGE